MNLVLIRHSKSLVNPNIPIATWGLSVEIDKKNIGIVSHGNVLTAFASQFIKKNAYDVHESMQYPDIAILNWNSKQFLTFFGEVAIE